MKHAKRQNPRVEGMPTDGNTRMSRPQTRPSARFVNKCNSEMGIEPSYFAKFHKWLVRTWTRLIAKQ